MNKKKSFAFLLCFVVCVDIACAAEPDLLPQKLLDEGWINLFDGQTLFGWQPTGDAKWEVVDSEIHTAGDQPGFLMTTTEWADFDLHIEFKAPGATNSGVFLRTALEPTDPTKDCYELNIAPAENPFPTGSLVGLQRRTHEFSADAAAWHTFDVTATPGSLVVLLDGQSTVMYRDPTIPRGHIGLQSKDGPVAFRNIRLRPVGLKSIFNGHDLTGWSTDNAEQCEFTVTDAGELRLTNGPGQIATNDTFANFVMQFDCFVNGDGLNSGVFFRTLPSPRWAGYESQINNRFKDDDRTKPADFGTGGIYRRQPARRVVADDHAWFTKTIVADGPRMAVWVNGYQASDWTDNRPPKESAREGRRDGAGTIAIQGHDPTTSFLFRNLRIAELP